MAESLIVEDVSKWIGDLQTLQGKVECAQADLLKDVQKKVDEILKEPNLSFVDGWERITKLKTLRQKIGTEVDEFRRCLETSRNRLVSDTGEARIQVVHNKYVREADNLFEVETLEGNKKIKVALKDWELKRKEHENRLDRKEVRSGQCKNEVYQLVGYFVVFQGVMFTAVAQSSMLFCNNVWSPATLSVLASIATIAGVSQKLLFFRSLEVTITSEKQTAQLLGKKIRAVERYGSDFNFSKIKDGVEGAGCSGSGIIYCIFVIIALGALAVSFTASISAILCHPGKRPNLGRSWVPFV